MSLSRDVLPLVRPHRVHSAMMRPLATDAAWSVCVSVGHKRESCKNGRTDRDADWVVDWGGWDHEAVYSVGVRIPQ